MFTGIIEETGFVRSLDLKGKSGSLEVKCSTVLNETKRGDSIAVNGVCLTVTEVLKESLVFDVMAETIRSTALDSLKCKSPVNLERSLKADGRFGGHIVQGHVDGKGRIVKIKKEENAVWLYVSCKEEIRSGIVLKGSVAINGISLTVQYVDEEKFGVSLIPHTYDCTALKHCMEGEEVNLEYDIVGKYIRHFVNILSEEKAEGQNPDKEREQMLYDFLR